MQLYIRQGRRYRPASPNVVREAAAEYAVEEIKGEKLTSPDATRRFLKELLGGREHEVFVMITVDSRHRVIETHELFRGTIDRAHVYPREVVKTAVADNAAAVIVAHNHPSGEAEPSQADMAITRRLRDALGLLDIRLLDHFIVGYGELTSFAQRGLI